ncbi:MAG: hypothetical protein ABW084_11035 [Candidatus Thiodiazotropha sp.]
MSEASFLEGYLVRVPVYLWCSTQLWSVYAEEIIRQEYASQKHRKLDEEQLALDFDDPIPF